MSKKHPNSATKGSGTVSIPYNKEYKVRSQKYTASAAQAQMPTDSMSISASAQGKP